MFARSSKRALSSTRQTACLPRSTRADQRGHERRVVARAVHGLLDGEDLGIGHGLLDEPLDRARERVVRVVDQDVALAHGGHHVRRLVLVGLEPRLGDRRPRLVAQVGEAVHARDAEQVLEVEQAVDLEQLALVDVQRAHERRAQLLAHPRPDLDADHLAKAAPAQLGLDGTQQVVGLVVDGEVGVAGDAEDVVVDDLHAREELVQMLGDQALEGHERAPVPDRHEAREHLLRHLHAREGLLLGLRVAHEHGEREREVGDVREGTPEPDGERREDREDLAPETLAQLVAVGLVDVGAALDAHAVLGERGAQHAVEHVGLAPGLLADRDADRVDRLRRAAAVLARLLDPRVDVLLQPGDAHHEELVEVRGVDRAELQPLQQRDRIVLRELEDAVVEVQPGQLAIEVQRGIVEIHRRRGGRFGLLEIRHVVPDANAVRNCERRRVHRPHTQVARAGPCARSRPTARGSGRRAPAGGRAGAPAARRGPRGRARGAPA